MIYVRTNAKWIWYTEQGNAETELALFYREVELRERPSTCPVILSADTRYQLFVNGQCVQRGPLRAGVHFRYYDTVDLAPFLRCGINRVAVKVLHYSADPLMAQRHEGGPAALISSIHGGLMLDETQTAYGFSTDEQWYGCVVPAYKLRGFTSVGYANVFERMDGRRYPFGWEQPGACADGFSPAVVLCTAQNEIDVYGVQNMWRLKERPLPMPFEKEGRFERYTACDDQNRERWERFLTGEAVELPPFTTAYIELNTEDYISGYPVLQVQDGLNAEITVTYSEAYGKKLCSGSYVKDIRDEKGKGKDFVDPESDSYCCGRGEQLYSPVYYRAFRFIRLEIVTGETPLTLKKFFYIQTGYPLEIQAQMSGSDDIERIWDISLRTLQNCSFETYMDCPYFEQMQYVMDGMLQAQYTYPISTDIRLTQKAMRDFYEAQLPDGLIPCYAPSKYLQIIPCFGLYWVLMIAEYYSRFGDLKEIREYFCGIEKLFGFFERNIHEDGLYHHAYGWNFVDWVPDWYLGNPVHAEGQVNLLDNLLLLYALKQAVVMMNAAGRRDMAAEYSEFYEKLKAAVVRIGYDHEDGLFRSVTNYAHKSQHAQVLAVLSGLVDGKEGRQLLQRMLDTKEIDKISFSTLYFLFRALEMVGLYDKTERLTEPWRECLQQALYTMPESVDLSRTRSDCHAWSALPLYEYTTCYLGVRPAENGRAIAIKPQAVWVPDCEGSVVTPQGIVKIRVWQENGNFCIDATTPEVPVYVELPNGRKEVYPQGGHISLSEQMTPKRKKEIA